MNTNNLLVIELAAWFLLIYKWNYHVYLKRFLKLLGRKSNAFAPFKPFDCYQCINLWSAVITAYLMFNQNWPETITYIATQYLLAAAIQTSVEK